jgi:hypothetical protein
LSIRLANLHFLVRLLRRYVVLQGFCFCIVSSKPTTMSVDRSKMHAVLAASGGPSVASGWGALWQSNLTGWDLGKFTAVLSAEFDAEVTAGRLNATGAALIPGCGSAYDARLLAQKGMSRVVGLDFAPEAIEKAKTVCADTNVELICGDLMVPHATLHDGSMDFIFDYTCFCAIPPSSRPAWGQRLAGLLKSGGRLLTLAYPLADDHVAADPQAVGPPFPVSVAQYKQMLEPHGVRMDGEPRASDLSVTARQPNERVIWWTKL